MESNSSSAINEKKKSSGKTHKDRRRTRRRPLLSLGSKRLGTELGDKDANKKLLHVKAMPRQARVGLYAKLLSDMEAFITRAGMSWDMGEECRRFTIFGESITVAKWNEESLTSGGEVVKTLEALFRLHHLGNQPSDHRRFEDGVISDLRNLKADTEVLIEEAGSPLLKFLFRINAARTHKRQKIYKWNNLPFDRLYQDALDREERGMQYRRRTFSWPVVSTENGSPQSWGSPDTENSSDPSSLPDNTLKLEKMMALAIAADSQLQAQNLATGA